MKIPKIDTAKVRKTMAEITKIILDKGLAKALQSVGQDKALLAKAKANPKAFLKAQGFTVPDHTLVAMGVKKFTVPSGEPKGIVPRFTITMCFTYVNILGEKTRFYLKTEFKDCVSTYIW